MAARAKTVEMLENEMASSKDSNSPFPPLQPSFPRGGGGGG